MAAGSQVNIGGRRFQPGMGRKLFDNWAMVTIWMVVRSAAGWFRVEIIPGPEEISMDFAGHRQAVHEPPRTGAYCPYVRMSDP